MSREVWVMAVSPTTDKVELMQQLLSGKTIMTEYLLSFDPDASNGRGSIAITSDLSKAKRFDSFAAVMDEWKTQSKICPLRDDGKPNRPLTAFTIEPVKIGSG